MLTPPRRARLPVGLQAIGTARPAQPQSIYAEDFSLLIRWRRLRFVRGLIVVLQ